MNQETFQVLEQKKKFLTFEELCKEWSALIAGHLPRKEFHYQSMDLMAGIWFVDSKGKDRYLSDPRCCMVGEAHGDDGSYYHSCNECTRYSDQFYNQRHIIGEESFEILKNDFVNHFNEVHI
jgi:hypothetical protein